MDAEFWHARWQENQIGFHESRVHALLRKCWGRLDLSSDARVFVPLCGKSLDMVWLRERGHTVIGAELSEIAIRDFFAENELSATRRDIAGQSLWQAPGFELWCGDFFALTPAALGAPQGAYDRAALIALPPAMRIAYAAQLLRLLPHGAQVLLITLQYPVDLFDGPPFSVAHEEIAHLFGSACRIEHLEQSGTMVKGRFDVLQTATRLVKNFV